jgi:hypothetical protein
MKLKRTWVLSACLLAATGLSGFGASWAASTQKADTGHPVQGSVTAGERPVAPETNPPGDIPDSQVLVRYVSPQGGYAIEVPEGSARRTMNRDVTFQEKLDRLSVTITPAAAPPDVSSIRNNQAAWLKKTESAVEIKRIQKIQLSGKTAVFMAYESNSEPDPLVNNQFRLENSSYLLFKDGKLAELRLWAPVGCPSLIH